MKRKQRLFSSDRNNGDISDNSPGISASQNLLKPSNFKQGDRTARPEPKKQLSFRAIPLPSESESQDNSSEHE
jgi:hypothetical protein